MNTPRIVIERRFHGPKDSANGGYTCGRIAEFIEGPARVRLRVPPPLDVEFGVRRSESGVSVVRDGELIAEAWPGRPELEIPEPPTLQDAETASRAYSGYKSHRYATCFVCGPKQAEGGLRVFAGPVPERNIVASPWRPDPSLASDGLHVDSVFIWSALDCPGGFTFPEPEEGAILLGELSVELFGSAIVARPHVVFGWEFYSEGRKHHTGTALFTETGDCVGVGQGIWFEVP